MKNRGMLWVGLLLGATAPALFSQEPKPFPKDRSATVTDVEAMPLFIQGKKADSERYQFAVDHQAMFRATPDGRSFYILWYPKGTNPSSPPPMIVTLHGHGSWAFDEFYLWQPHLAERGYGILALQWWFGEGEKPNDYYQPPEIYRILDKVLHEQHVLPHTVLAHGFSRGSANIYGVTAMDHSTRNDFFLLTVANAGTASRDFPFNGVIERGELGVRPFEGTHWVMYAGAHDPHPDRSGVAGMREARDWVTGHGGSVDLLIEDPEGGHGGFHRNPANTRKALDLFKQRLAESR